MMHTLAIDLMIPIDKYPHVLHTSTIKEVASVFKESRLEVGGLKSLPRAVLVFDEENHALGLVRRRDILRGLEPKFLRTMTAPRRRQLFNIEIDPNLVDMSGSKILTAVREQAKASVSEIMQPIVGTLEHDDLLAKIIYKMLSHNQSLMPVLKNEKVIGVVRSVDAFHEVVNNLL